MKIITKEIEQAFQKQGDTSQMSAKDIKIVLKLFGGGAFTWYLYEKIDDDTYMAFVNLGDPEMSECGYVSMSEIMSIKFPPFGLGIERDMYFKPLSRTLEDVMNTVKSGGHV
jgi:hypothetical protein